MIACRVMSGNIVSDEMFQDSDFRNFECLFAGVSQDCNNRYGWIPLKAGKQANNIEIDIVADINIYERDQEGFKNHDQPSL